jgi:hypothetical protein
LCDVDVLCGENGSWAEWEAGGKHRAWAADDSERKLCAEDLAPRKREGSLTEAAGEDRSDLIVLEGAASKSSEGLADHSNSTSLDFPPPRAASCPAME